LTLDPQSVEAQTWLAHSLAGRVLDLMTASAAADIARAEGLVNRVLAERPRSPLAHFVKGNVLRCQGRCEQAIPEYETALALNGSSVVALNGLAWCKIYAGSPDEAIPLENEVIRLSPRDPAIGWRYLVIGTVHLLQSRTDQAIVWLEKARSAIPAAPAAHGRLAAAYALEGEPERAAAELAEARRVSRDERHPSIARLRDSYWGGPKARALAEDTLFAGYRKAGMPEE
jgi:tetratricopeptide (TPR) repeat protein